MINGTHFIIYSTDPKKDRNFFLKTLQCTHVDVGDGWLIFGLPPAEVAVHPAAKNGGHELCLMTDDIEAFVKQMKKKKIVCSPLQSMGWGILTQITLPGGGQLGIYQPRHARPAAMKAKTVQKAAANKPATPAKKRKVVF